MKMKLSIYIYVILLCVCMPYGVYAQSPALQDGIYQFEDLTSPEIELEGTWGITSAVDSINFPLDFLSSISGTSNLQFSVVDSAYITIYQGVWDHDLDDYTIQVDATTYSISNDYPYPSIQTIPIPVSISSTVTITRDGDSQIYLDYLTIHSAPIPEATAEPYYIYNSVSDTDGNAVDTRFDMIVTAGDVAVSSALLFLFFSLWAFIFLVIIPKRDNNVGK